MKSVLVILIMFLSLVPPPAHATIHDNYEARVQYQVNKVRESYGLPRARFGSCVNQRAEDWALHLRKTRGFYHQDLQVVLDGCRAVYAGEIIAKGRMRPWEVVERWMDSPPHRAVMLSPQAERIGVGVRWHRDGGRVTVVNFLRK